MSEKEMHEDEPPLEAFRTADKSKVYEAARAAAAALGLRSPNVVSGNPAECFHLENLLQAYVSDSQARGEMHAAIEAWKERDYLRRHPDPLGEG